MKKKATLRKVINGRPRLYRRLVLAGVERRRVHELRMLDRLVVRGKGKAARGRRACKGALRRKVGS